MGHLSPTREFVDASSSSENSNCPKQTSHEGMEFISRWITDVEGVDQRHVRGLQDHDEQLRESLAPQGTTWWSECNAFRASARAFLAGENNKIS